MISFDEASAKLASAARPLATERVSLRQAFRRVLAEPVAARLDSPPATVSAMDGYAVRDRDVAGAPVRLRIVGQSFAGAAWTGELGPGECARIFTGAAAPANADRVVMQEDVLREGDEILVSARPDGPRHLRAQGSDFRKGEPLLLSGRRLDARALLVAAAADAGEVEVFRRPRVALFATGDELAEPGSAAATPGAIPDSVSLGIAGLVRDWGGDVAASRRLADDPGAITAAAAEAVRDCDVLVVLGGASVGEKDYAKAMIEPLGAELIFSKVAMKPGKPVWFASAEARLILGLPGNPTSAYVAARLFLAPLLAGLSGRDVREALAWRAAPAAGPIGPTGARETFHRARRLNDGRVELLAEQESGAQKALASADVLVRRRVGSGPAGPGEPVEALEL